MNLTFTVQMDLENDFVWLPACEEFYSLSRTF